MSTICQFVCLSVCLSVFPNDKKGQKLSLNLVRTITLKTFLSLRFNGHFPGEPGLAGFIEAKDDGSGGDNYSYKLCKAPVKSLPPTNQHPTF